MNNLSGKCAIITGASNGIGRSIALKFAEEGAYVIINYNTDIKAAEETLNVIRRNKGYAQIYKADISDYTQVKNLVKFAIDTYGKVDILVNNAGISKVGLFMDFHEDQWDSLINVNIKGVFNCSHAVIPNMIQNKKGVIINMSSMWGNSGASCEVVYSATKGAVNSFTKALAKEMGPSNIRVNAISPGVINTRMNQWLTEEEKNDLLDSIPLTKFGETSDVANLAAFLAEDNSSYITGQIITIDGGFI
ncbi:MAG: 3-oxoacyl-[acyl-carrier-protein] reductase [Clostridiaceae bacterium]|jgi:3-oxoacyl-[acyl-carrier protein] reductase|nr:3-oxoacyl-[acyl-carrier-protein] reductase [Clostridiaceae bacterium]